MFHVEQLANAPGRVIVKIDLDSKDSHTFRDGTKIEIRRRYNNMNHRHTDPVNAVVVSAENIPEGTEILIHHNSAHDVNRIFDYVPLSGKEIAGRVHYFSLPQSECFLYRVGNDWLPLPGFTTALRVFKPYTGIIEGIEPELFKDLLYVTSGELKGKVVYTLRSCDYEIIFQDTDGRENRVIRFRHWDDGSGELNPSTPTDKREEVIGIANLFTEKVETGEYFVGIKPFDAKPVNEWQKQYELSR